MTGSEVCVFLVEEFQKISKFQIENKIVCFKNCTKFFFELNQTITFSKEKEPKTPLKVITLYIIQHNFNL